MKQIVDSFSPCKKITIDDVLTANSINKVICYITSGNKGLAILQGINPSQGINVYGFCYHSYLIHGENTNLKFEGNSPRSCIKQALHFNRELLVFESFQEFLEFSSKYYNDYSQYKNNNNEC